MVNNNGLFRPEVLLNQRNRNYGSVLVNTPIQYVALSIGVAVLCVFIIGFLILGEYSEKFIVKGYLESTKGIVSIFPDKNGVIKKCYFKQGDSIHRGDPIFLIATSHDGLANQELNVLKHLEKKKSNIERQLREKQAYIKLLKKLLIKKFISLTLYQTKQDEIVELKHQLNNIAVEIIHYKQSKSYVIPAPIDGEVASVIYKKGQYIHLDKPLMKILPKNSDFVAELFIPARQSGFIHIDDKVMVRFDAYPYTRFGFAKAKIYEISKSILTDDEEYKPIRIGEPYYKITAVLDRQFIMVYGKAKKIQHGMTISAVIVGTKRKIWQWIFDPIYSFYGGLFL